ncbi:MAG: penicillin acylase family protein [Gemmatimonadota bacterium]|nr:penicillin acylase family protein [Gemmatimonadota bacterium]
MTRTVLAIAPAVVLSVASVGAQSSAAATLDSARARLAKIDGSMSVPGLDSVVEVRRDRWGVPHIYARTQHDLFLAQGWVAAQDRLWQMEMWRRTGEGRLAEVLGPQAVERDRFARLLRYRGDMAAEWRSYAPDAGAIVRDFVHGVNAYIHEIRDRPPIEFTLLGIVPEPWTDAVPLQRMAALAMTGNALSEVERARLVALVGPARAAELWPTTPRRALDPAPEVDLSGIDERSLGAARDAYGGLAFTRIEGSNNWVVSGARSASGKPLLANDPHRGITLPSLRYLTHLVAPGWNVVGGGEPSLPGVAGGHNDRIGFGFTIVGMDQQDVYVEQLVPCPSGAKSTASRCYLTDGEARAVERVVDTIRVRGESPRVVVLEFTRHGPIVSVDSVKHRAFALRFVGSEPGTAGYLAQLSLDRARDWPSFRSAAERWKLPTENLVYADVEGNIGWIAAGLSPVRSWSGLLPVPGDGRYEWRGFLRIDDLPQSFNPRDGIIVTANNDIRPPGYAKQLNYDWAPPYRADRIRSVLDSGRRFTVGDFERLQHDELSLPARALVPMLVRAAERFGALERPGIRALASWNDVMSPTDAAPLLFEGWLAQLGTRVSVVRSGSAAGALRAGEGPSTIIPFLQRPSAELGENPERARDSLLLAAFDDAMRALTRQLGPLGPAWIWGNVHRASFPHPIARAFDLPAVPRGGDGNTVNATGGAGFSQTHGASYRVIIDFADFDASVATNVPGQSAQPGSEYYDNLLPLWAQGRYFPLPFSRAAVERATAHVLTLAPAPVVGMTAPSH